MLSDKRRRERSGPFANHIAVFGGPEVDILCTGAMAKMAG